MALFRKLEISFSQHLKLQPMLQLKIWTPFSLSCSSSLASNPKLLRSVQIIQLADAEKSDGIWPIVCSPLSFLRLRSTILTVLSQVRLCSWLRLIPWPFIALIQAMPMKKPPAITRRPSMTGITFCWTICITHSTCMRVPGKSFYLSGKGLKIKIQLTIKWWARRLAKFSTGPYMSW